MPKVSKVKSKASKTKKKPSTKTKPKVIVKSKEGEGFNPTGKAIEPTKLLFSTIEVSELKIFDVLNIFSDEAASAAIIAPTIITDEIALVTDIKGVCNDGVTLQTT